MYRINMLIRDKNIKNQGFNFYVDSHQLQIHKFLHIFIILIIFAIRNYVVVNDHLISIGILLDDFHYVMHIQHFSKYTGMFHQNL